MNKDNLRPVTSIKHDDKRAAIPDSAHQSRSGDGSLICSQRCLAG